MIPSFAHYLTSLFIKLSNYPISIILLGPYKYGFKNGNRRLYSYRKSEGFLEFTPIQRMFISGSAPIYVFELVWR